MCVHDSERSVHEEMSRRWVRHGGLRKVRVGPSLHRGGPSIPKHLGEGGGSWMDRRAEQILLLVSPADPYRTHARGAASSPAARVPPPVRAAAAQLSQPPAAPLASPEMTTLPKWTPNAPHRVGYQQQLMATRFAASLRADNRPHRKEAQQPTSHALTSD